MCVGHRLRSVSSLHGESCCHHAAPMHMHKDGRCVKMAEWTGSHRRIQRTLHTHPSHTAASPQRSPQTSANRIKRPPDVCRLITPAQHPPISASNPAYVNAHVTAPTNTRSLSCVQPHQHPASREPYGTSCQPATRVGRPRIQETPSKPLYKPPFMSYPTKPSTAVTGWHADGLQSLPQQVQPTRRCHRTVNLIRHAPSPVGASSSHWHLMGLLAPSR